MSSKSVIMSMLEDIQEHKNTDKYELLNKYV